MFLSKIRYYRVLALDNKLKPDQVLIEPILKGVAQILGVILALDSGACDLETP